MAPDPRGLPDGFVVVLAPTTRVLAEGALLLGGRPRRMLRLHASVRAALIDRRLVVADARTAYVARRLLDSGLAHPCFPTSPDYPPADGYAHNREKSARESTVMRITARSGPGAGNRLDIVVPVRDRPRELARLLAAIRADPETASARVIVVDDGSHDPDRSAAIAGRANAEVVRHGMSHGPAAARNTGLAAGSAPRVAFLDSDCVPMPGWLDRLARHLDDPAVALTAPRIVAGNFAADRRTDRAGGSLARLAPYAHNVPISVRIRDVMRITCGLGALVRRRVDAWLSSYEHVASALDLGPDPGRVEPGLPVSYVSSAALLARRAALGAGFDATMTVAEDVDLVWRLAEAGWTVRYDPSAEVAHDHRTRAGAFLARRAYYGTGAALLALRHGAAVAPVVIAPWTALAGIGVAIGSPWSLAVSVASLSAATVRLKRVLETAAVPAAGPAALDLVWRGTVSSGRALLRPPGREYWPVALAGALLWPAVRRRVLIAAAVDGVLGWWPHRRTTGFWGFVAARRLEDLAYGAGVWYGVVRAGSLAALRPRIRRHS